MATMHKNPFKKKRGEGYIPDHIREEQKQKENDGEEDHSLATASMLAMQANNQNGVPKK